MSRSTAGDRLDDSFPHGTPEGYQRGCRGNGGCRNRDTSRMTCKEADLRYHQDLPYRRAYDAGDIWLDRPTPRGVTTERVRAARRGGFVFGNAPTAGQSDPVPTAVPAQVTPAADLPQPAPVSTRHAEEARPADVVDVRTRELEDQLGTALQAKARAEELAAIAGQERAAALAKLDQALAVIEQQKQQPPQRPVVEISQDTTGGLRVSFAIAAETVQLVTDFLSRS